MKTNFLFFLLFLYLYFHYHSNMHSVLFLLGFITKEETRDDTDHFNKLWPQTILRKELPINGIRSFSLLTPLLTGLKHRSLLVLCHFLVQSIGERWCQLAPVCLNAFERAAFRCDKSSIISVEKKNNKFLYYDFNFCKL